MSGPCLSSSVAGRPLRPATRHRLGEPLPHQLADRPRAHPRAPGCPGFSYGEMSPLATFGINPPFDGLSPTLGQVAHVLRTLAPLSHSRIATQMTSFDLHVLSTPPAFVLSQNQTLRKEFVSSLANEGRRKSDRSCSPLLPAPMISRSPSTDGGLFDLNMLISLQRFDV